MKSQCIVELIMGKREIEFIYHSKRYSITYYNDKREKYISVCEYYHNPIDVKTPNEVLKLKIGSKTLKQIFSQLPDSAFNIS